MGTRLGRLPWFVSATAVVAAMIAFGIAGNILIGVYFERTTLTEADPLAGLAAKPALAAVSSTPALAPTTEAVASATSSPAPTQTAAPTEILAASPTASASASASAQPSAPTATPARPQPTVAAPAAPPATGAALLLQGTFKDGAPGHRGSGTAKVGRDASGQLVLVLADFSVTSGPDLRVILSPAVSGGGNGLDLGKLKATDGTFSYSIPGGTDLSQYKSVTIWCKSFPTIFAYATLEG